MSGGKGLLCSLLAVVACGSPTDGTPPPHAPTGTLLVHTPNGAQRGTYLVDVTNGATTQIVEGLRPLSFPGTGGFTAVDHSVFGLAAPSADGMTRIGRLNLTTKVFDTLMEIPQGMWLGGHDLSPDAQALVLQTGGGGGVRLWTVDLASGTWTQRIDPLQRLDTVPLTSLKWTPNGRHVYALTEVYPHAVTELIRFTVATDEFEVLTPRTGYGIVPGLDVSPDGLRIVHTDGEGRLVFRDLLGNPLPGLPSAGPQPKVNQPIFSPDGNFVAFTTHVGPGVRTTIEILRLSDGTRWPLQLQADFEFGIATVDWF